MQRSRASLELAYVQGPLLVAPSIDGPGSQSDSDSSAPDCSSGSTTNEPTPAGSFGGDTLDEPVVKEEEEEEDIHLNGRSQRRMPLTLRAKYAARAPSSRWYKRKQSFKLRLGPFTNQLATRSQQRNTEPDPSAQLLELFGDLLDARMESCMRVTRLIRDSNRAMLYS